MLNAIQKSKEHNLLQRLYRSMSPRVEGVENKSCAEDVSPSAERGVSLKSTVHHYGRERQEAERSAWSQSAVSPDREQQLHAVRLTVMARKTLVNCFPLSFGKSVWLRVFSRRRKTKLFKTIHFKHAWE